MAESSTGLHSWAEAAGTPPDVVYRFVVSRDTLEAGDAAFRETLQKGGSWRRRLRSEVFGSLGRLFVDVPLALLIAYGVLQLAILVYRAVDVTQRPATAVLLAVATFLATYGAIMRGFVVAIRYIGRRSRRRHYLEYYADNTFAAEGRRSHLWVEEQGAGGIFCWSTFDSLVEFEGGLWLRIRPRIRGFVSRRAILFGTESLPGSCSWDEFRAYAGARIGEQVGVTSRQKRT